MKRTYWTHPNVFEAEVEVTVVGHCQVTTDPVIFHPDEGGQPADKGTIGAANVCDVKVFQGRVVHTLDQPLADGRYLARVDREHRLHTATQHTAQHILSGIAARAFGLETTSVHIGMEGCTVDFDRRVEWDVAEDLERRAMDAVTRNIPVETVFNEEDEQTRSRLGPIDADIIRIVKIGDCDKSACCGAHLATTGGIGLVRISDLESRKQGTRMSFLAGKKALQQSQAESSTLRELRKLACCATADLPDIFQKALERAKELTKELERVWALRLADLAKSAELVPAGEGQAGIYVGELPRELVPTLAGMIAEAVQGVGIAVGETHVAISSRTLNAGALLAEIRTCVGGKGGGSPKSANGRLDRPVTKDELVRILMSHGAQ